MPFQSTMQGHLGPQSTLAHDQAEIGSAVVPEIEVSSPPKTLAEAGYPGLRTRSPILSLLEPERDPSVPLELLTSESSRTRATLLRGGTLEINETNRHVRDGLMRLGFNVVVTEGQMKITNPDHRPTADQDLRFRVGGNGTKIKARNRAARDKDGPNNKTRAPKTKAAPPAAPPGPPMLLSTLSVVSLSALPGQPPTMMLTDGQTVWGVTITSVSPA